MKVAKKKKKKKKKTVHILSQSKSQLKMLEPKTTGFLTALSERKRLLSHMLSLAACCHAVIG